MAHLKTLETRHDLDQRYEWKWHVTLALYRRGYKKQDVIHLFLFIDWIMTLPEELKRSFSKRVIAYEEERKMKFISSVEELGIEKGMEKGMLTEAREMVAEVLAARFSAVPEHIVKRLSCIEDRNFLKQLLKKAVLTRSIEQFELEFQG